ncbi:unnamed protein product [Zymoseptoria tritici ST99CH_1A5]|uniref:SnoaL-like domain-containing protein n=3 Tax=Zymoseptoria tritici TaxID=1047171 RepID=F9XHS9_ZYMTI|nr:uncharacterized protein MYCGRDRAFT_94878 [Zymoseptoria tritici IPO323]EGP85523.1 hypothetical protein MYCGRDRAFT_94878 [Zymoseptoria tritici IPO323]SMR56588.1 unnamed protein product [Zymoseptoria tritici ST99CH_1E4]SMR59444.1 unnamed protein product [Zymoseptoria tritici ST99CH_3D1]SMY26639.1 unnamed protein product [Zymoseptoria tritici ST99CH_1A5]
MQAEGSSPGLSSYGSPSTAHRPSISDPSTSPSTCTTYSESAEQLIVLKLDGVVRDMITAVNERNFSSARPPWSTNMSPTARVVPGNLLSAEEMDRQGYLDWLNKITAARPHFRQIITDLMIEVKHGRSAEVIAQKETHGSPPGLIKPSIVSMEFRLVEERWLCTSIRSVHGIGSMING